MNELHDIIGHLSIAELKQALVIINAAIARKERISELSAKLWPKSEPNNELDNINLNDPSVYHKVTKNW